MEENQGTFKIDLSASDGVEEKISNIVPAKKSNGYKTTIPESPAAKNQSTIYIAIGLVFISIIFAFGYFSLRSAIKTINISGAEEIANLSKELNEKIATVNQLIEDQKKALKDDISGVSSKMKTIESNVNKAEKANKNDLQAAIADMNKELDPLKKQVDGLKPQIDKMAGKTDEVSGSVSKIQAAIQKNQQEIEKISASNIDAAKLEAALKKERDAGKQTINTLTNDISTLKKSVKDLEDRVGRLKGASSAAPSSSTGSSSTTRTPSTDAPTSKPGGIVEEEIH
jgi:predicted  nucleic acid-binding Zn-ribbon protein